MLTEQQKILALAQYEGRKPTFMKGIYSAKHDSWKCGNCGAELIHGIVENFCFNCGYRVLWDNPRCLTGKHDKKIKPKQMEISDFLAL